MEIGDAAHYLVTQAGTAGSLFYGNLDVNRVAAVGHSQGAGGATRAALSNPALIKTLMTFSLPITYWLNGPDIAQLTRPASIVDPAYGGNPGGELCYATAWLAYQLLGDPTAATAFTGATPELVANANWPGSAVK